jgi:hypothetical protein
MFSYRLYKKKAPDAQEKNFLYSETLLVAGRPINVLVINGIDKVSETCLEKFNPVFTIEIRALSSQQQTSIAFCSRTSLL